MRRLSMIIVCMVLLVSIVVNSVLVLAQEPIYYYRSVFKVGGVDFYINVTYVFRNPDSRVSENNTITYLIRPYNTTHLNVTTITVYYLYYYYYGPQVKKVESSSWRFMRYDPNGYIVIKYNGTGIPTFNVSTYSSTCDILDNHVSRVMSAQFGSNNMIDVVLEHVGSVSVVDDMLCPNNSDRNEDYIAIAIMGGKASGLEIHYIVLAYIPILLLLLSSIYYFIKRKLMVRGVVKRRN